MKLFEELYPLLREVRCGVSHPGLLSFTSDLTEDVFNPVDQSPETNTTHPRRVNPDSS